MADLEALILATIPLAREMGVRVVDGEPGTLMLTAPPGPNSNDKGTAFAGSLYALLVLCGWGLVTRELWRAGLEGRVMIAESSTRYRAPVHGGLRARAAAARGEDLAARLADYKATGRASVNVRVVAEGADGAAVELSGCYAIRSGA